MKKVKILSFNQVDSQGDVFTPDSIKIKNPIMLTENFDHTKPLGNVDVTIEKDGIYTELNENKFKDFTPSIGFEVIKSEVREDGTTEFKEIRLHYVGLSMASNIDPEIKPL